MFFIVYVGKYKKVKYKIFQFKKKVDYRFYEVL